MKSLFSRSSFIFAFLLNVALPHCVFSNSQTIVEKHDQISDFDARFEMAKILSHHKATRDQALQQYALLTEQNPHQPQLLLEIARTYMSEGKFDQAFDILLARLNKRDFILHYSPVSDAHSAQKETLPTESTIVPPSEQIDDDHARLELARVLSYHERSLDESLEQYLILIRKHPHSSDLALEISRVLIRLKKFEQALTFLYPAIEEHPQNTDLLLEASHAERALGHAKQSQTLIVKAIALAEKPAPFLLDYAETLMFVGSFYKAEEIYKNALKDDPHSLDLYLKWAWNLVSSQRYEEAEGLYRELLWSHRNHPKILEALVTLKMIEKDFCEALKFIDALLSLYPNAPSYILLRANALFSKECYNEALAEFENLANFPKYELQSWIGMGRTYRRLAENDKAQIYFQKAYDRYPDSIEAQFYLAGEEVDCPEFIQQVIERTTKPDDLEKWANVYAENGMAGILEFQAAALRIDPNYYPAQIGLADALGTKYRYDEAIEHYLSLLESFPDASKLTMAIARVLSWGKQYHCSFEWYDRLIALNPEDPVPRREKARVAYWGYFFDYSMAIYQELLAPPVDKLLLETLQEKNQCLNSAILDEGMNLIIQALAEDSIYTGYENFASFFKERAAEMEPYVRLQVDWILIQYLSDYRIQKSIFLESYAKRQDWQNYYMHALPIYNELVSFSPGNEEALYSYAQDYCSLGLCKCSRRLYYHILNIDPNHSLVKMALQRNLMKENWLVQSNYLYWKERGSGQFSQSQIARHEFDQIAEWSPSCDLHLRFIQNTWIENPFFNDKYYPAEGQTIEVDHQFNAFIKGSAGGTRKNYFQRFPSRYTCFSTLWFNCYDYFNFGIGFERRNEIYNYFSLKEAIQAKVYWGSITSNLTHYWTMGATYRHLEYNDKNTMEHVEVLTTYTFSDDPNIFKIILQGSYRNTAHITQTFSNSSGQLVWVIHPYWTPKHYYSNSITLEYRHNFAFFNYCEAPLHYLDIKITGEDDTARNPSLQLSFEWRRDFFCHWGFEIKGMIHQSRLWNAEGAWVTAYYRF